MPKKLKNNRIHNPKTWKKDDIEQVLNQIAMGNSIRSAAKKYGMSEGVLRRRIEIRRTGTISNGPGRKITLSN